MVEKFGKNDEISSIKSNTDSINEPEKKENPKEELESLKNILKGKKELLEVFDKYSSKYFDSEQIIYEIRKDIEKELNQKEKFEGFELKLIYDKYSGLLDTKIIEEKKKFETIIKNYIEEQKEYLKEKMLVGINEKNKKEVQILIENIYKNIENIGISFINTYQKSKLENQILYYEKEQKDDIIEKEVDKIFKSNINFDYETILDNEILIDIKNILNYNTLMGIKDYEEYINTLKELSNLKGINDNEIQEREEKSWSKNQKNKEKYSISNGFQRITGNILKNYGESKDYIKNKTTEIITDIVSGENFLEKIRFYIKKYGIFMYLNKTEGLENILEKLLERIGVRENINYKKEKISKPKLNQNINENDKKFDKYKKEIENTINKIFKVKNEKTGEEKKIVVNIKMLLGGKYEKLKEELDEIYKTGIKTENPTRYWNDYSLVKKYEIKQPISNHKNENNMIEALKNALEIKRIEFMQKDLIKRDFNSFMKLKKIIGGESIGFNRRLIDIYGVNDDITEYLIDYEKEYGKTIDSVINKQIEKDKKSGKKYGILNIFGNKTNMKNVLYRIFSIESMGNVFTWNGGVSSALGILQKLDDNYENFKINPFNVKESIESFFESIIRAFNNYLPGNKLKKQNYQEKTKIAILIHFLGEGTTKKILEGLNWNVKSINKNKKAKITFDSISDENEKIKVIKSLGLIKDPKLEKKRREKEIKKEGLDKKLKEIENKYGLKSTQNNYYESLMG